MATDQLQSTIKQVHGLSFEEQLQLIKYLADRLVESQPNREPRYLVYGKFLGQERAECPLGRISKSPSGIRQKKSCTGPKHYGWRSSRLHSKTVEARVV